jgi:hypothetical protein
MHIHSISTLILLIIIWRYIVTSVIPARLLNLYSKFYGTAYYYFLTKYNLIKCSPDISDSSRLLLHYSDIEHLNIELKCRYFVSNINTNDITNNTNDINPWPCFNNGDGDIICDWPIIGLFHPPFFVVRRWLHSCNPIREETFSISAQNRISKLRRFVVFFGLPSSVRRSFLEIRHSRFLSHFMVTVVGANLCVRRPLELKDKRIRGVGGIADKEAHTAHTIKIISQRQYFVARCLISFFGNIFGLLHSIRIRFPSTSTHKLVT